MLPPRTHAKLERPLRHFERSSENFYKTANVQSMVFKVFDIVLLRKTEGSLFKSHGKDSVTIWLCIVRKKI